MESFRAAAVQFQHAPGDRDANLAVIESFVEQAAEQDVRVIVFPECCVSGYWHLRNLNRESLAALAEAIPDGPTTSRLQSLAAKHRLSIGAGLVEVDSDGVLYNAYVVAMPNGQIAVHRKLHCFISPHMSSGESFTIFDLPDGTRAAILICYDNNIGENVRACALAGAEILFAPHQTGGTRSGSPHGMKVIPRELWERREQDPQAVEAAFRGENGRGWLMRWLPTRAHDNGLFVLFSNGVGPDDDEVRTGNAMILDPYGRILAETWAAADKMVVADLDATLRDRCTGVRWIRARRPELYESLTRPTGRERATRDVRFDYVDDSQPPDQQS